MERDDAKQDSKDAKELDKAHAEGKGDQGSKGQEGTKQQDSTSWSSKQKSDSKSDDTKSNEASAELTKLPGEAHMQIQGDKDKDKLLKWDEKGHFPQTDTPKGPGVAETDILSKGTGVLDTEHGKIFPEEGGTKVPRQIARSGKPLREDTPAVAMHSGDIFDDLKQKPEQHPSKHFEEQTQARTKIREECYKKVKDQSHDPTPGREHKTGKEDSSTIGAREGSALNVEAEHLLGNKVHHLLKTGESNLEVQSADKSNSESILKIEKKPENLRHKYRVELLFPGINPDVSQRELLIKVTELVKEKVKKDNKEIEQLKSEDWKPAKYYFPPDVPRFDVLLPKDAKIHVELTHIGKEGHRSHPYILDFYNSPRVELKPLEASPIGYAIREEVTTYEPA